MRRSQLEPCAVVARDPAAPAVTTTPLQLPETGFLRQRQVLAFVPISKSTLWRQVQSRDFPAPVKLSAHVTAWRAEDVRQWIQAQGRRGSGSGPAS